MSLTSILTDINNQDLRDKFKNEFIHPKSKLEGALLAEPKTKNYALVGIAFDYLIRYFTERINQNKTISSKWVAETAIGLVNAKIINNDSDNIITGINNIKKYTKTELLSFIQVEFINAKINYNQYLKTGAISKQLIVSVLFLGKLEIFRRNYNASWAFDGIFDNPNPDDIKDINSLFLLLNENDFTAKEKCILNPTFGIGSILVDGADADLIIDDTLIEIKVTKNLKLDRDYLNQLIGYYILSLCGGVDNVSDKQCIKNIGVYFARHGILWKAPLSDFGDENKFNNFKEWFINYNSKNIPPLFKKAMIKNETIKTTFVTIKYYIDTKNESIEANNAQEINMDVALNKLIKINIDDFIGFINGQNECIQFVKTEKNKWLIDCPQLNNEGHFTHSLTDENLTIKIVSEIIKCFYENKEWEHLCNLVPD